MNHQWWIQVLAALLLIGGIHPNPGPTKGRKKLTNRKDKKKRQDKYTKAKEGKNEQDLEKDRTHAAAYMQQRRKTLSEEDKKIEQQQNLQHMRQLRTSFSHTSEETERGLASKRRLRSSSPYREHEKQQGLQSKKRLRSQSAFRECEKEQGLQSKQRLRSYSAFRQREKELGLQSKQNLRSDSPFRQREKELGLRSKQCLRSDSPFRQREKELGLQSKQHLRSDSPFRQREKELGLQSKQRLRSHSPFRQREKELGLQSKQHFRSDSPFRQREKELGLQSKQHLRSDSPFRQQEKELGLQSKQRLRSHSPFRQKEKEHGLQSKKRLRSNSPFREQEKEQGLISKKKSRVKAVEQHRDISFIRRIFKNAIQNGPVFVCSCCKRMLYRHSVVHVPRDKYSKIKNRQQVISCLTGYRSFQGQEWICKTCHQAIKSGRIPAQAEINQLYLDPQPFEIVDLSPLEERLVSLRLPFMQLVNLPRGSQKGIKGPVVNIPSSLDSVISLMPRLPSQYGLVPLKLKRKLTYKGHVLYQSIRPTNVMAALRYLKKNHKDYAEININEFWVEESYADDKALAKCLLEADDGNIGLISDIDSDEDIESDEDLQKDGDDQPKSDSENKQIGTDKDTEKESDDTDQDNNSELRGLPYNSCLQSEADTYTGKEVFSVAPGEGKHPVSLFTDPDCEVLAFPSLFPTGRFGWSANRPVRLSPRRYFNQRILNVDQRFAQNVEYMFFAQYLCEAKQILDNISIAMRKGSSSSTYLTAGRMSSEQNIEEALKQNEGYRFLQTVKGSYPYRLRTLFDLNAMVRQLDIPTWFCSFSAADLKWPETIRIIAEQQGQYFTNEQIENMDWQQKCLWQRSNPVTAARHFDFRVSRFLHDVLLSPAAPIGQIKDYFIRTEFQQRGSPHIHCLFWVAFAPKIGSNSEDEVCRYIDQYIRADLPNEETEPELYDLVSTLQTHTHSVSCCKSGKHCRFNFPRPPTDTTLIAGPPDLDNIDPTKVKERKVQNSAILKKVQDSVIKDPERTLDTILQETEIPKESYITALRESASNPSVILQRQPSDNCINNYNPDLLQIWEANLDIQFVTNAYACAMYILSYVSKGERQMGELLKNAAKECIKEDSIRKNMRQLGNVFLTHRELSIQEADYRLLSMALKRCSRLVVFVNTGLPEERTRLLKSLQKLLSLPPDSTDIFENGIVQRYASRPDDLEQMHLADFATLYRNKTAKKESDDGTADGESDEEECDLPAEPLGKAKEIVLKDEMGVMTKRRRRACLRSPRFSETKNPERYYHSLLMLYHPWRNEVCAFLVITNHTRSTFRLFLRR